MLLSLVVLKMSYHKGIFKKGSSDFGNCGLLGLSKTYTVAKLVGVLLVVNRRAQFESGGHSQEVEHGWNLSFAIYRDDHFRRRELLSQTLRKWYGWDISARKAGGITRIAFVSPLDALTTRSLTTCVFLLIRNKWAKFRSLSCMFE